MPADFDQLAKQARAAAGGASAMWGLVLDHLADKHTQSVAATRVNPEGGVARTADGVVVTSKELYLQVLLNADDYYTNAGYQERMSQSFGPIFLGMDWGPEYEKQATPTNAASSELGGSACGMAGNLPSSHAGGCAARDARGGTRRAPPR